MKDRLTVLHGHCIEELKKLKADSVHCVVTSPPYWALRDYGLPPVVFGGMDDCEHEWVSKRYYTEQTAATSNGSAESFSKPGEANAQRVKDGRWREDDMCAKCGAWRGQHGLEPTPELYVEHEVLIFREVRRVLRKDGTCWVNLGDCYSASGCGGDTGKSTLNAASRDASKEAKKSKSFRRDRAVVGNVKHIAAGGLQPKQLVGIPWRVAFALQADGWYLRSDIIWHKPNPMPESVSDRPTKSHEYIFLLTKSQRYFYDAEAIKEKVTGTAAPRMSKAAIAEIQANRERGLAPADSNPNRHGQNPKARDEQFNVASTSTLKIAASLPVTSRNKRSVWTVNPAAYREAHFATFPPDLIKPCILAGTSAHGACSVCGTPYERVIELGAPNLAQQQACGGDLLGEYYGKATKDFASAKAQNASEVKARILAGMRERKTVGWEQQCECDGHVNPCVVLDPFGGSFTTGAVAIELGREAIMCELNEDYVELGKRRCAITPGLALA